LDSCWSNPITFPSLQKFIVKTSTVYTDNMKKQTLNKIKFIYIIEFRPFLEKHIQHIHEFSYEKITCVALSDDKIC
jgi:hypothetical protein